jgi:hypothetical protein
VDGLSHALFRTLPGRAIVIGLAVKIAVFVLQALVGTLPLFVGVVDTVASIALAVGGSVFLARGLTLARRRLLWRVRRKLIISYIFIGFIPAILLVAFALLGALLLFSNFSSYLVQARLTALADRAESIAKTTALEIQRAGSRDLSGIAEQREAAAARRSTGSSWLPTVVPRPSGRWPPPVLGATWIRRGRSRAGSVATVSRGCWRWRAVARRPARPPLPPPAGRRCRSTAARCRSTTRQRPPTC